MYKLLAFIFLGAVSLYPTSCSLNLSAQERSEYAGQEKREIKTLSESDIEQLLAGKGWGLAKAAELNGFPGPVHVIEMKGKLDLSENQLSRIETLYNEMKKEAVPLGTKLVGLEKKLNVAFADKKIDEKDLKKQLDEIAGVTKDLRFVHLAAHLKTVKILSAKQVSDYNRFRGYGSYDPCETVPEGHDPEMWKKHNNCKQ